MTARTAYIHHIETLVPPYAYRQDYARDQMIQWLPGKRARRLIRGIYNHSGIDTRYSVLPDFVPGAEPVLFSGDASGQIVEPTTEPRNNQYAIWSRKLVVDACRSAFRGSTRFVPTDVTHVITASCTGFCNPGPDLHVVQGLGLPDTVERYHLGFMGCYAAIPALRMAQQFCQANPKAVVLVVCIELCTLHLQVREEPDSLLANAIFADGVAAALVSAQAPGPDSTALALHSFSSALAPEGVDDMAWSIGDHGFNIRLSTYVPDIIAGNVPAIVDNMLGSSPWSVGDMGLWAVHPGGRAILDKVESELGLAPEQIADARTILREYGNMSSATILFVLKRILERGHDDHGYPLCAMAFGPGLTIETAILEQVSARVGKPLLEVPTDVARD